MSKKTANKQIPFLQRHKSADHLLSEYLRDDERRAIGMTAIKEAFRKGGDPAATVKKVISVARQSSQESGALQRVLYMNQATVERGLQLLVRRGLPDFVYEAKAVLKMSDQVLRDIVEPELDGLVSGGKIEEAIIIADGLKIELGLTQEQMWQHLARLAENLERGRLNDTIDRFRIPRTEVYDVLEPVIERMFRDGLFENAKLLAVDIFFPEARMMDVLKRVKGDLATDSEAAAAFEAYRKQA